MRKIFNKAIDWIYPPRCIACGALFALNEPERHICADCRLLIEPIKEPVCSTCGRPTDAPVYACPGCVGMKYHFTSNKSWFLYDSILRDMLLGMKFGEKKYIATGCAALWAQTMRRQAHVLNPHAVYVPLPMHPKKKRERGFNQADVFAQHLGAEFGVNVQQAIVRKLDTPPQAGLGVVARVDNVHGAFAINPRHKIVAADYVIIDDIFTTGASANECANVLLAAGVASVAVLTLAATMMREGVST